MKGDILSQTDWLVLPLITVVLFTVIFTAVLVWIMRPGARDVYKARGQMIFDESDPHSRMGGAS